MDILKICLNTKGDVVIKFFIKQKRLEKGLSMTELSKLSGVSISLISLAEAGLKTPSLETLCKLALALECTVADLYYYEP